MNILITIENGENRKIYFPKPILDAFEALTYEKYKLVTRE